jgi:hypothetical protein
MNPSYGAFAKLLMDKEATASALIIGLVDVLGIECLSYEPDTLLHEIHDNWRVTPTEANRDKIWAMATAMTTDMFTSNFSCFNHICAALSGAGASFEKFVPSDITEICWALSEIALMDPDTAKQPFNEEIKSYILLKMEDESLQKIPKILSRHITRANLEHEVEDSLQNEAVDMKAFWNDQHRKLLSIDTHVQERMMLLINQVVQLPLKNAAPGAQQDLLKRAQKALAVQSQRTAQEQADVPLAASL